jgi:hypothetical protein
MNKSARTTSVVMAGFMTTADGTTDVTARLSYKPRHPHVIIVTITDRAGAVQIWTIGRDLLLGGLAAQGSCPAGVDRVRAWMCQHDSGPSLMIAMMTSFAAFLELDLERIADFTAGTLRQVPQGEESRHLNLDVRLGLEPTRQPKPLSVRDEGSFPFRTSGGGSRCQRKTGGGR